MLVEDELMVALMIEDFLDELGCVVAGVAADVEDAKELIAKVEFDLAVLDINLSGQFSFPIALILRERGIPYIFSSGYDSLSHVVPDEFAHDIIITKPYRLAEFAESLDRACFAVSQSKRTRRSA
jgi:DNA-binding response OmpR family regulator